MTIETPSPLRFGYDSYSKRSSNETPTASSTTSPSTNMNVIGTEGLRRRPAIANNSANSMDMDFGSFRPPTASLIMSSVGMMKTDSTQNMQNKTPDIGSHQKPSSMPIPGTTDSEIQHSNNSMLKATVKAPPILIQDELEHEEGDFHEHISKWVIVIAGFNPSLFKTIQQRFESYGTVIAIHTPASSTSKIGNWVCLKYQSRLEAEKALCQDGTFHSMNASNSSQNNRHSVPNGPNCILIGVKRLNSSMIQQLGVDIFATGYSDHQHSHNIHQAPSGFDEFHKYDNSSIFPQSFVENKESQAGKKLVMEDESILLDASSSDTPITQKRKKDNSFMERVLYWIFMWD